MKKNNAKLLALCALQPCATVVAFTVAPSFRAPKTRPPVALHSAPVAGSWDITKISPVEKIEGNTRRTWQFGDTSREVVQVGMKTEGRPLYADVELWIGPDWTPAKVKAYSEDGRERPIQTLVGTRNRQANIEVRNTAPLEFPLSAACAYADEPLSEIRNEIPETGEARYIEGGAVYSVPFGADADQVQVLLNTDTRQLNTRVELLNGPNNIKQVFEVFTNNGMLNSLYVVFNTPGGGNVVRVTNQAPVEFPCKAYISAV